MRRKLVIGALFALGAAVVPTTLGSGAASEALNLPCGTGALGIACSGVETVYGLACGGLPTQVPTIEFVTINLENPPAVECPTL